ARMKLLHRERREHERPPPDEAPEALPEPDEPELADPGPAELSKRDYLAITRRAIKEFNRDHMTNIAAALAYYAFLAIPSALLVAVGTFSLVASPNTVTTVIDKLHGIVPGQATSLLDSSLRNMVHNKSTGITVLSIGGALAFWSLTGAMQNLMWALYIAEWPLLVGGLLVAFAGFMYYGPNVKHPRWRFLSFGSVVAIVIWLVAPGAFAFYVSKFSSYNKTWGSLAAVVVMLTWLWLSSVALLLGAEINAEAERSRELRRGEPADVELQAPAKA